MNSREYWRQREEENSRANLKKDRAYLEELASIYQDMTDSVQKEIDAFYAKYAEGEGITLAEAKKRADKLDIEAYGRKAKRYVKEHDFSDKANAEMKLYNLTMKVNRLELLKANIGLELTRCYDQMDKLYTKALNERTQEELKRQAGILGKSANHNAETAKRIVNASFKNATFSDRIWAHQDILRSELDIQLRRGMIQGRNPRVLAVDIRKKFGSSEYEAERLMRTELARVQTDAQKVSYEANGFDEYEYIGGQAGQCDICAALDGKHFKVRNMVVGENAPPTHPNCKCSTAPWMDREAFEEEIGVEKELVLGNNVTEMEQRRKGHEKNLEVLGGLLESTEYRRKFDKISSDTKTARALYQNALAMLKHRSGTDYEDMTYTDENLVTLTQNSYNEHRKVVPTKAMKSMILNSKDYTVISMHNHSGNNPPSLDDLYSAKMRKYKFGVAVCHDGTIYVYHVKEWANLAEADDILDIMATDMNRVRGNEGPVNIDQHINRLNELGVELQIL